MAKQKQILLTWDAYNNGFVVTAETIKLLYNKDIVIDEIIYLQHTNLSKINEAEIDVFMGDKQLGEIIKKFEKDNFKKRLSTCYSISMELKHKPKFQNININIDSVTNYQSIYNRLIDFFKNKFEDGENFSLHINVSPGTPQMHVVWLMLNASGFLPPGTTLWSSQWIKEQEKTVLNKVNFKPRTFLSEVLKSKYLEKYQPEINPNETISSKRIDAESKIELFAKIPDAPILLLGERGTGKSTYTNSLIYKLQEIEGLPFAELACGTFSEELMRSELFGYEPGAFTGANKKKSGILSKFKNGGILFLDEIHDLSKPLQRQLIQVLQTGSYYPIGAENPEKTKFRLVTASNRSIAELTKKYLDLDFLDRIARFIVEIPPLRECREDIKNYWKEVWKETAYFEAAPSLIWNKQLENFLMKDELKGNFRDLQKIAAHIIAFYLKERNKNKAVKLAIEEFKKWKHLSMLNIENGYFQQGKTHNEMIASFEKDMTEWAIKEYGSKKAAAEILNRTEDMLNKYLKMNRLRK